MGNMTEEEQKKLTDEALAKALSEAKVTAEAGQKKALEKAAVEVQAAERTRTAKILEAAGNSLGELAAKHIKDGTPLEEALLEINKALHDTRTEEQKRLAALADAHGEPAGPPPKIEGKVDDKKEGNEAWAQLTAAQKEEHRNDPVNYEVWQRNKHRVSGISAN